jgi:hypothetical protein
MNVECGAFYLPANSQFTIHNSKLNRMKPQTFLLLVTIANVLASLGYAITSIVDPGMILPETVAATEGARIFALYACARTLPLAVVAIRAAVLKKREALFTLALLAGCIQFLDGFIGIYEHDLIQTAGPFSLALVQFWALYRASGQKA